MSDKWNPSLGEPYYIVKDGKIIRDVWTIPVFDRCIIKPEKYFKTLEAATQHLKKEENKYNYEKIKSELNEIAKYISYSRAPKEAKLKEVYEMIIYLHECIDKGGSK